MSVSLMPVSGVELQAYIDDLARLRIRVFREYPYLYQGSAAYEQQYLQTSTGIPMTHESEAFRQPFELAGIDTATLFYCGESVLLPEYRGQGIYRGFFAGRERYVRTLAGFESLCFCAVVRPVNHPLKPVGYQPLDAVWQHFGYSPRPDLVAHYDWQDIDQTAATAHPMMFWVKTL